MPSTLIRVLLDTLFDEANDKMLMCMAYESVLHIMCMNDLCAIGSVETINANPLRRGCHIKYCHKDELSRGSLTGLRNSHYSRPFLPDHGQLEMNRAKEADGRSRFAGRDLPLRSSSF